MTNNTDEFDQDQFDTFDPSTEGEKAGEKQGLMEAWRSKPLVKLIVIMIGVSAALALVLGTTTKDKIPAVSVTAKAPGLNEAPGGTATPFFIEQNDQPTSNAQTKLLFRAAVLCRPPSDIMSTIYLISQSQTR